MSDEVSSCVPLNELSDSGSEDESPLVRRKSSVLPVISPADGLLICAANTEVAKSTSELRPIPCSSLLDGVEFSPKVQPVVLAVKALAALPESFPTEQERKQAVIDRLNVLGDAIVALPDGVLKDKLWPLLQEKIVPYTCG